MSEGLSETAKLLDQSNQSICMAAGLNGSRKIEKKKCVCVCDVCGTMDFYPPRRAAGAIHKQEIQIKSCQDYSFTLMKLER